MDSNDVVALIGSLAWPLTVLILAVLLLPEIKGFIGALKARVIDRNSNVSISKTGIEISTNLEAVRAKVETIAATQDQQGQLLLGQVDRPTVPDSVPITKELREMAHEYLTIDIPDWAARTRAKDSLAIAMGIYVVSKQISRDDLAHQDDEGLILALASAVMLDPQLADADRLLAASPKLRRLHVRYRVLLAFSRLFERHMLDGTHIRNLRNTLNEFRMGADDPLRRRIDWTFSLLETSTD